MAGFWTVATVTIAPDGTYNIPGCLVTGFRAEIQKATLAKTVVRPRCLLPPSTNHVRKLLRPPLLRPPPLLRSRDLGAGRRAHCPTTLHLHAIRRRGSLAGARRATSSLGDRRALSAEETGEFGLERFDFSEDFGGAFERFLGRDHEC